MICENGYVVLCMLAVSLILGPLCVTYSFTFAPAYGYLVRKALLLLGFTVS